MKIRKALNQINRELLKEIYTITEDHPCSQHTEEGMGCVLCGLVSIGKPLVLLHYMKNKGMIGGHLEGETRLLDLLGAERLKQRMRSEIDMIRNTPKKRCFNCGKIVTMWMPYSQAALFINSRDNKEVGIKCCNCGVLIYFSNKEVKFKKQKNKDIRNLVLAIQLANRLGYSHQDSDPDEEPPDDMEYPDQDDDDNYDPDE